MEFYERRMHVPYITTPTNTDAPPLAPPAPQDPDVCTHTCNCHLRHLQWLQTVSRVRSQPPYHHHGSESHTHGGTTAKDRLTALMEQRRRDRSGHGQAKYTLMQQIKDSIEEFCATTSAHGLPRVAASSGSCQRFLWSMIFALCLAAFLGQAYMIVDKFNRNEKIVNVELKFEKMPFPAVTVCNLNPFKRSMAEKSGPVSQMLQALEGALESNDDKRSGGRSKRTVDQQEQVLQVVARSCWCNNDGDDCSLSSPAATDESQSQSSQLCLCVHNVQSQSDYPCYPADRWRRTTDCGGRCDQTMGVCHRQPTTTGPAAKSSAAGGLTANLLSSTSLYDNDVRQTYCWCENVTQFCVRDQTTADDLYDDDTYRHGLLSDALLNSNWPTQPVQHECACDDDHHQHCHPLLPTVNRNGGKFENSNSRQNCVCAMHRAHAHVDQCAPVHRWRVQQCTQCNALGICAREMQPAAPSSWQTMCLCANGSFTCIALDASVHRGVTTHSSATATTMVVADHQLIGSLPKLTNAGGSSSSSRQRRETPMEQFQTDLKRLRAAGSASDYSAGTDYDHQIMYPSMVNCYCESATRGTCMTYKNKQPEKSQETCICPLKADVLENVFDRMIRLWPCYPVSEWHSRLCTKCSRLRACTFAAAEQAFAGSIPCLCVDHIRMCVQVDWAGDEIKDEADRSVYEMLTKDSAWVQELNETIVRVWEVTTSEPTESPVQQQRKEEALGFQGMKDVVAIRSKARENLIFATSKMNESEKSAISTPLHEFIKQCSFNGRECSVEADFELHVDPTFGNCFTFNSGETQNMTSDRAGPNYGLRLQIFVNTSEYLPTTEASGVRITVHPADEEPFPDTIGFSAPVGSVSGFGIHLKRVDRLPKPYGDCVKDGKTANYIYQDKAYTVEGCHRSCMQHYLIDNCGCGDPRFPTVNGSLPCPLENPDLRRCLAEGVERASKMRGQMDSCVCHQPCQQFIYSVSYSAATWPASHVQVNCTAYDDFASCLSYYRNEAVMIEIFYEALNYEALKETDAYGWPNLLSDFGGQLGLWMGVSVITCMEFLILCWSLLTICFCCGRAQTYSVSKQNGAALMCASDDPAVALPLYTKPESYNFNGSRQQHAFRDRPNGGGGGENSFFLV